MTLGRGRGGGGWLATPVARDAGRTWARAAALAVLGALAAIAGCTVGSGSGSATGPLWVIGCDGNNGYGTEADPEMFSLQPTFFAGEPLEDLSTGPTHQNRLIIRMQRTGLATQYNDTLYFDVENSYEVARCLRGRTVGGVPDWKVTETLSNGTTVAWCDWSGTAFADAGTDAGPGLRDAGVDSGSDAGPRDAGASLDGGMSVMAQSPRIHLTPDTDLRSSLALLTTCPMANVSAEASDGWIQFASFGSAEEADVAPEMRDPVTSDFAVSYGGRLRATFHVALEDVRIITAQETLPPVPLPAAQIGGVLDGNFDFDLQRGRAAQAFP